MESGTMVSSRRAGVDSCQRMLVVAGSAVLFLAITGCSISRSVSDSISSPFQWSSDSSNSSDHKQSYQEDVRDYTATYFRTNSDPAGFRSGLASVAQKHGVTNWEADQATYTGIGQGLGKAQVKDTQVAVYKMNLAGGDSVKAAAMQKGYDQYKRE